VCRWLRIVSVIVAASVSSATATAAPVAVTLCVDDTRNVRARAARELRRWPSHVRIALSADPDCRSGAGRPYVGWFERRGRRVYLAVRTSNGKTLRRALPRLSQCDGCLARLAAHGKLVELSVILQGLVLEHSLGLSSADPGARSGQRTPPDRAPGEHPPRQPPEAPETGGAERIQPPSLEQAEGAPPPGETPSTPEPSAAPPTETEQGHSETSTRPAASQPVPAAIAQPDATERRSPAGALPVQGHEVDEPGMQQVAAAMPESPRPSRTETSRPRAGPPVVRRRTRRSALRLRDFSVHTHVAGRWRSSDLWSLELGGSLGWRSLILRVGYQLPAEWSFGGRPVEATAIPMLAGWRPALWKRPGWRLRALAGVAVERIALRRLDLPDASWHRFWDVGVTVGATFVLDIGRGLQLGTAVEATWFPAGQEVEIQDGPTATFNQLGLQAVIQFSFGGAD
jgi:hypothetical protein